MEMVQLTARKTLFDFSAVNWAKQSYFAFTKNLKSTKNEQKVLILSSGCNDQTCYMIQSKQRLFPCYLAQVFVLKFYTQVFVLLEDVLPIFI